MRIDVRRLGDADLVIVAGALDLATTPRLRAVLDARLAAGRTHLVLDLADVNLLDAGAIGLLAKVAEQVERVDGRLSAINAVGISFEALGIAGLNKRLNADDEPADILARYRSNGLELGLGIAAADASSADVSSADASPASDASAADVSPASDVSAAAAVAAVRVIEPAPVGQTVRLAKRWPGSRDITAQALLAAAAQEIEPWVRADLRNQVIEDHMGLAQRLARRFRDRGEPLDDLTQVAALGLVNAVDGFDPARGSEFIGYATPTIVGEIRRYFRDKGWRIKVPRRLQELRIRVSRARAELSQTISGEPTVAELAAHLGIEPAEVNEAIEAARVYQPASLSAPTGPDSVLGVADLHGADDPGMEAVENRAAVKPLLAALPERERRILALRYFGELTQAQIAAELGISQMHVSRLLNRTLGTLRTQLTAA